MVTFESIGRISLVSSLRRPRTNPGEEDNRPEHMPPMDETILTDAELQLISDYIEQTFVQ